MSSVTVTLSGNSSTLEADFFPPILLNDKYQYECGLVDFQTFNCIPSVDETNNSIVFCVPDRLSYESINILLPTGSYEIVDIFNFVKSQLDDRIKFELRINKNTLKCEIQSSVMIDTNQRNDKPNTIGGLLGFSACELSANRWHTSDRRVEINRINAIRVECSIITSSYFNNESVHTIHEFFPNVEAGYKIIETPQNVIYLPITVAAIHTISLRFIDQNSRLIDFRGENIVTRLHIRRVRN